MSNLHRKHPFQSRIRGLFSRRSPVSLDNLEPDQSYSPPSVKLKMILPALLVLLIAAAAAIRISFNQLEYQQLQERKTWMEKVHRDFQILIREESRRLNYQLDTLLQNEALLAHFKSGNRDKLKSLGKSYYQRFQQNFGIFMLDWVKPDGTRFLSFQSPDDTTGRFNTALFLATQRTGDQQTGIDTGLFKTISLRTFRPIRSNEQIIGYLQIGKPLSRLTSQMNSSRDIHLITVSAHSSFHSEYNVLPQEHSEDPLISSTLEDIPEEWILSMQENGTTGTPDTPLILEHDGESWYGFSIPIHNVNGENTSFLWVLENERILANAKREVFWFMLGIAGVTALILFVILWRYPSKIESEIQHNHLLRERAILAEEKSRQALTESEERFRTLFMEMEQGALIQDTANKIQLANPAACRILNIPMDVIIGAPGNHPDWEVIDKDGAPMSPEQYPSRLALSTGRPVRKVIIGLLPPGQYKYLWLMLDSFPHIQAGGEVTQTFSTFTDITDLKESERTLRNERMILEEIFEASKVGYWDVDLTTDTEHYSPTFKSMLGYTEDELNGIPETWKKLIYQEDLPLLNNALHEHITSKGQTPLYLELRYRHKKGHLIWVICAGKVIHWDDQGKPLRAVGCHIDISERKRVEEEKNRVQEQLANMHKLESIGRLAGGVAHDSNNLLQLILGHTEMALNEIPATDTRHFHLKGIQDAAQRSAKLIQQLLAFARKQVILPRILQLNHVIEESLSILRQLLGNRIELEWHPDPNLDNVLADPTQINQILTNLCTNARDAITGKGRVTIKTENILLRQPPIEKIKDFKPGMYVMLSVKDDGKGIPEEIIDRIFEPFFSTKQTGQGIGLGLSTVYGIVKQNQGVIEAISPEGEGSTFRIYLPRFQAEQENSPAPSPLISPLPAKSGTSEKQSILLIDDEHDILRMAAAILEQEGYQVTATSMVSDAISIFERAPERFALLISDVVMPGINGHRLLNHFRKQRPNLQWLLMSGYPLDVVTPDQEDHHFLHKPFTSQELISRVAYLLNKERDSDPT